MVHRIDIIYKIHDSRSQIKKKDFEDLSLEGKIEKVDIVNSYLIESNLATEKINQIADLLTNHIFEKNYIDSLPSDKFDWSVEIGLLPGVTDNVGSTAKQAFLDYLGDDLASPLNVYSSTVYLIQGSITKKDADKIAQSLYNPLIQYCKINNYQQIQKKGHFSTVLPKVKLSKKPAVSVVKLPNKKIDLEKLGKKGIENKDGTYRGPLALSLEELEAIKKYFDKIGRSPTDVELETLAQTWSEHCKHTIFNDPLDDIGQGLFTTYIKKATDEIRKRKGNKDFCVSVFKDNSGAIEFDRDYLITHKVETHNSPSALDPYGGAITGIVGVNRDTLGFGLCAKPIVNVYGFCFADPQAKIDLYRDKQKKEKMLPPKRIMQGVVEGVNVGGNSSGIPTPLGFVCFDNRFAGKPLVFVGTVGIIPKKIKNRPSHIKKAEAGDYIVMVGGRVGIDGIHGATFSSESLTTGSPSSAVQIGDPITQKKFSDALAKEARDLNLYNSITDNGAGGLSSSVGEMAIQSGGCKVDLEKVPLKYQGLDPWQIWISESQERMTLAVPKNKWKKFESLMNRRGVESTIIGEFTSSGKCIVCYNNKTVLDLDMNFLHFGRPEQKQKSKKRLQVSGYRSQENSEYINAQEFLIKKLSDLNITSYEFISQQFDHTVQGSAVTPPLQGRGRVNSDAAVIKPVFSSNRGIVLSQGIYPQLSDIDTYYMATHVIDLAVRNAVAAGADPDYMAILDNFCWSSSNDPHRLWELKRAVKACYDTAIAYGTPFISGKDSMFNDFKGFDEKGQPVKISVPPTLLISAIGVVENVEKSVTLDFKNAGNLIYLLGSNDVGIGVTTGGGPKKGAVRHLAASIIWDEVVTESIPTYLKNNLNLYRSVYKTIQKNLIASAISISRGGLAVAIAKSAIAGMLGVNVKIDEKTLFNEPMGQILISTHPKNRNAFENLMEKNTFLLVGKVTEEKSMIFKNEAGKEIVNLKLNEALKSYKLTLRNY